MGVFCKILESFVGNEDEVAKYGGQTGVIPWAQYTKTGTFFQHNVVELEDARALELQQRKIVKILDRRNPEPLDVPHERLLSTPNGYVDKLAIRRAEEAAAKAAAEAEKQQALPEGLTEAESATADAASDALAAKAKGGK